MHVLIFYDCRFDLLLCWITYLFSRFRSDCYRTRYPWRSRICELAWHLPCIIEILQLVLSVSASLDSLYRLLGASQVSNRDIHDRALPITWLGCAELVDLGFKGTHTLVLFEIKLLCRLIIFLVISHNLAQSVEVVELVA